MSNKPGRKILIAMIDSFTQEYFQASEMPNLREMVKNGFTKSVNAVMPTVTNVNNTSICTGAPPSVHGITANSYFDIASKEEKYMDRADLLLAPTIFEKASEVGTKSALLTAKAKTIRLLKPGAELLLTAEEPTQEWVDKLGPAPDIYDYEINHWLFRAVHTIFKEQPEIDLIYYHTTDCAMHFSDPMGEISQKHLKGIDKGLGEILDDFPDMEVYLTGDHGMNYKSICYDLNKYMPEKGLEVFFAMSAERDPYIKHHRTFGGAAYVWLNQPADYLKAKDILLRTEGIEAVYTRYEAASLFDLHPDRIGDVMVLGDKATVFGPLDGAVEDLPKDFRTHGSLHEFTVPIIVYNSKVDFSKWDEYTANYHVWKSLSLEA